MAAAVAAPPELPADAASRTAARGRLETVLAALRYTERRHADLARLLDSRAAAAVAVPSPPPSSVPSFPTTASTAVAADTLRAGRSAAADAAEQLVALVG